MSGDYPHALELLPQIFRNARAATFASHGDQSGIASCDGRAVRGVDLIVEPHDSRPHFGNASRDAYDVVVPGGLYVSQVSFDDGERRPFPLELGVCHSAQRADEIRTADVAPCEVIGVINHAHLIGFRVPDANFGHLEHLLRYRRWDSGHLPRSPRCGTAVPRFFTSRATTTGGAAMCSATTSACSTMSGRGKDLSVRGACESSTATACARWKTGSTEWCARSCDLHWR